MTCGTHEVRKLCLRNIKVKKGYEWQHSCPKKTLEQFESWNDLRARANSELELFESKNNVRPKRMECQLVVAAVLESLTEQGRDLGCLQNDSRIRPRG